MPASRLDGLFYATIVVYLTPRQRIAERVEMMDDGGFGWLIWMCAIGAFVWFTWLDDSKLRYEIQYYDTEVIVEDMPPDCDFMTAPLGRKNCSFQKNVAIVLFSKDIQKGEPIISYDDGETWDWNRGGPTNGGRVHVFWVRTED